MTGPQSDAGQTGHDAEQVRRSMARIGVLFAVVVFLVAAAGGYAQYAGASRLDLGTEGYETPAK